MLHGHDTDGEDGMEENGSMPIFNYQDLLLAGGGSTSVVGDRSVPATGPGGVSGPEEGSMHYPSDPSLPPHQQHLHHPHHHPSHMTSAIAHPPPPPMPPHQPQGVTHQGYPPPHPPPTGQHPYPAPPPSSHGPTMARHDAPSTSTGVYSMEEIEAAMLKQEAPSSHPSTHQQGGGVTSSSFPPPPHHPGHLPHPLGAEVHPQVTGGPQPFPPHAPPPPHPFSHPHPQSSQTKGPEGERKKEGEGLVKKEEGEEEKKGKAEAEEEEQVSPEVERARKARKEKLDRQSKRMAEYVGMMSQGDKEYIQKVQIAQLVGEEGDDFYCQMYLAVRRLLPPSSFNGSSKSQGAGNASSSHQGSDRRNGPGEGAGRSRMQQQIQRIVQDARARTKKSQVSKEGALGKVSVLSARNPKQSLQIAASKSPGSSVPPSPKGEEGSSGEEEKKGGRGEEEKGEEEEESKASSSSVAPLLSSINATSSSSKSSSESNVSGKRTAIPTDTVVVSS